MKSELSLKAKWFHFWVFALFGAGAVYFTIVKWPYPKLKDVFCVVAAFLFSTMTVVTWLSIRSNWSREKYDRATTIAAFVAGIVMAILLVLNSIGLNAASR